MSTLATNIKQESEDVPDPLADIIDVAGLCEPIGTIPVSIMWYPEKDINYQQEKRQRQLRESKS